MANIIDAFLVTLGLDSTEFRAGVSETEGEMKKLQEESKQFAEKTKEEQKNFQKDVKASSDAVAEFSKKSAQEAALAYAKLHELQQVASQPGAGKAAQSAVKAAAMAESARAAEASINLKRLQEDAKNAQQAMTNFQMKAAQEATELATKIKQVEHEMKETAEHAREHGEKGSEFFKVLKEHAVEFLGIMASIGAWVAFTEHTIKAQTAMNHLSEETKMSVEEISKWQNAVVIAGGSAEGFNQSLKGMGESLVAIEKGLPRAQRAMKAFEAADIHTLGKGKHVEITDMYDQIHEKLKGLSMADAQTFGKRMQLDEATIRVLHKSGEEYDEFMEKAKEAGITTAKQAAESEKAEESMNEFKITMQRASEALTASLIPAITWMMEKLTGLIHWAKEHPGTLKAAFAVVTGAILLMNAQLLAGIPIAIAHWATQIKGAVSAGFAFITTGGAATAMWAAILGPVSLVILAIAAVITILVALYKKFEGFRNVVHAVIDPIINIFRSLGEIFGSVIDGLLDYWDLFIGVFTLDGDRIKKAWASLWKHCADIINEVQVLIQHAVMIIVWGIEDAFNSLMPKLKKVIFFVVDYWDEMLGTVYSLIFRWLDSLWEGVKSVFHSALNLIGSILKGYISGYVAIFHGILTAAKSVWNGVKEAAMNPLKWIEDKLKAVAGVISKVMGLFHKTAVSATVAVVAQLPAPAATNPTQKPPVPITSTDHPNHPMNKTAVPTRQPTQAAVPVDDHAAKMALLDEKVAKLVSNLNADLSSSASNQNIDNILKAQSSAQKTANNKTVTSTTQTHIDKIEIQTKATDAAGIAKDMDSAVKSHSLIDHADTGMV